LGRLFIPPAGFSRQFGLLNEGGSVKSQQIDFFLVSVLLFFSVIFTLETVIFIWRKHYV